jgi:pterin-4a-carbinolamine dehydratase
VLAEVASQDLSKLAGILDPSNEQNSSQILDSLLSRAVQEVSKGNAERAVGYLADYATRDPQGAEHLPLQPELEPVRDKIDSMVSRMTEVAKMSAENGLSRAEQTVSANIAKLADWETQADVLLKIARRIFEAGGYANYSRTSNLARAVTEAAAQAKHVPAQALAASAAASVGAQPNQVVPGVNVPYWTSLETEVFEPVENNRMPRGRSRGSVMPAWREASEIGSSLLASLWMRAPLLVLLLTWFLMGACGGLIYFVASRIWPDGFIAYMGDFGFELWGIGLLALVGFGFYVRIREWRQFS